MLVIYGAGAVGLLVGARLARAGVPVLLVTRRPEAARRIQERGVRIEDPASGRAFEQRVEAVCGIEAAAERIGAGPVLFCMRSPDTAAAARALAVVAPRATVASLQNDVDNEELLSAEFPEVIGGCVRQTQHSHSRERRGRGRRGTHPGWPLAATERRLPRASWRTRSAVAATTLPSRRRSSTTSGSSSAST